MPELAVVVAGDEAARLEGEDVVVSVVAAVEALDVGEEEGATDAVAEEALDVVAQEEHREAEVASAVADVAHDVCLRFRLFTCSPRPCVILAQTTIQRRTRARACLSSKVCYVTDTRGSRYMKLHWGIWKS